MKTLVIFSVLLVLAAAFPTEDAKPKEDESETVELDQTREKRSPLGIGYSGLGLGYSSLGLGYAGGYAYSPLAYSSHAVGIHPSPLVASYASPYSYGLGHNSWGASPYSLGGWSGAYGIHGGLW